MAQANNLRFFTSASFFASPEVTKGYIGNGQKTCIAHAPVASAQIVSKQLAEHVWNVARKISWAVKARKCGSNNSEVRASTDYCKGLKNPKQYDGPRFLVESWYRVLGADLNDIVDYFGPLSTLCRAWQINTGDLV